MPVPNKPLRVLRIITRLNVGGPSYQAIFLTQRLQDAEFQSGLLVGSVGPNEGSMEPLARERGIPFTQVPGLGREISLRSDFSTVFRLYREIRRFRPDIVHTHLAKAGAVGRLAARMARVPSLVHTYHGHVFHGYFSKRKTELFLRIERTLARWTKRIIVLGEAQKREILGFGVGRPEQMVTIPLGLELEPFLHAEERRGKLRAELGMAPSVPLVGIVARLVPIKDHELFLEAAALMVRQRPETPFQFLIVGDGDLRQPLEAKARSLGFPVLSYEAGKPPARRDSPESLGGTSPPAGVHFLGFRSDLVEIYADLDVAVLCSANEGLPVTVIEALAAARPVVATDVGAVRDLVEPFKTGALIPHGDPKVLAEAILLQLEDRQKTVEAMAKQGRERVYPRLSIERLEADIRALYHQL
jgi:glycosyltransferase involved in cell wall biosynthesis